MRAEHRRQPRPEPRIGVVILALALVLAIAAYLAEMRESSALRIERRRAAETVRAISDKSLKIASGPGLRLMHPWGTPAVELSVPLGSRDNHVAGSWDYHAGSSFGKIGLVDSAGLRGTIRRDEDPSLSDSALVLKRLGDQLVAREPRFGQLNIWHGSHASSQSGPPTNDSAIGCIALPGGMLTLVVSPLGSSGTLHEVAYSASMHSSAYSTTRPVQQAFPPTGERIDQ